MGEGTKEWRRCLSEGRMELEANGQEKGEKGSGTRSGLLGSVGGGDGDEDGLKVTRVEEGEARREERSSRSIEGWWWWRGWPQEETMESQAPARTVKRTEGVGPCSLGSLSDRRALKRLTRHPWKDVEPVHQRTEQLMELYAMMLRLPFDTCQPLRFVYLTCCQLKNHADRVEPKVRRRCQRLAWPRSTSVAPPAKTKTPLPISHPRVQS